MVGSRRHELTAPEGGSGQIQLGQPGVIHELVAEPSASGVPSNVPPTKR